MDIIKYLKVRNYVIMASPIKGPICAWRNSLLLENWGGKPWSQIETYQTNICMPDKQRGKKPWKNINTDGKEIADLQETMRSDSSAGSVSTPDLAAGPKRGLLCSQVSKSRGRCGSVSCVHKSRCPACNSASGSLKICKSPQCCLSMLNSKQSRLLLSESWEREKKNALYP